MKGKYLLEALASGKYLDPAHNRFFLRLSPIMWRLYVNWKYFLKIIENILSVPLCSLLINRYLMGSHRPW